MTDSATGFDSQPRLEGPRLALRPLRASDRDALDAAAADPLIWTQHPDPDRHSETGFDRFFAESLASGGALVVIERASDARRGGDEVLELAHADFEAG